MANINTRAGPTWSSRTAFILAAVGAAVGLGNIWKCPYVTGEYGGGAFVLVYLLCIALVGLPLMYAELIIGRRGGRDILGRGGLRPGGIRRWFRGRFPRRVRVHGRLCGDPLVARGAHPDANAGGADAASEGP